MSTVTISTNRRRVYQRRFDHDEMRELRATGEWTLQALADRYGERLNDDGDIHCRKCGEHKPITMFRLDRGYPHFQCRTCETATRKAYRAAHRDQDRQWHADRYHRKKHDPEWMERKRETQRQYRQRRNQAGAA